MDILYLVLSDGYRDIYICQNISSWKLKICAFYCIWILPQQKPKMQKKKYFWITRILRGPDVLANSKFSYFRLGPYVMGLLGVPEKTSFTYKTLFSKTKQKVSSLHVCGIILFFKWHVSPNQSYSVINVTPSWIYSFHKFFLLVLLSRDMVPLRSWASLFWLSLLPESVPGSWACVWFLAEFQHPAKGLAHRVRNWGYTPEIKWSLYKGRPVCLNK